MSERKNESCDSLDKDESCEAVDGSEAKEDSPCLIDSIVDSDDDDGDCAGPSGIHNDLRGLCKLEEYGFRMDDSTPSPNTPSQSTSCTVTPAPSTVGMNSIILSYTPYNGSTAGRFPFSSESDIGTDFLSVCRICHLPGDHIDLLISPCRCAGTLQFIHQNCLQKWLEISTKNQKKPPKCELCHYQFLRYKKFKFHHWKSPRVSHRDKCLHTIFFMNLLIMISCAVATIMCFLSDKGQIGKLPRNKVDLTTEEILTLSCGVLFFVSFFIGMAVEIKAKHTIYKLVIKFFISNMEYKVAEYDKHKDLQVKRIPHFV